MTKTEELNKLLEPILIKVYEMAMDNMVRNGYAETIVHRDTLSWAKKAIPKACKKAGLKFTQTGVRGDDLEGACVCQVEEIDVIA